MCMEKSAKIGDSANQTQGDRTTAKRFFKRFYAFINLSYSPRLRIGLKLKRVARSHRRTTACKLGFKLTWHHKMHISIPGLGR